MRLTIVVTPAHKRAIDQRARAMGFSATSKFVRLLLQEACPSIGPVEGGDPSRDELLNVQREIGEMGGRQAMENVRRIRPPRDPRRKPPEDGSAALTPRQRRIEELKGEGLTERVAGAVADAEERQGVKP